MQEESSVVWPYRRFVNYMLGSDNVDKIFKYKSVDTNIARKKRKDRARELTRLRMEELSKSPKPQKKRRKRK